MGVDFWRWWKFASRMVGHFWRVFTAQALGRTVWLIGTYDLSSID
jgi:hypothetical protein